MKAAGTLVATGRRSRNWTAPAWKVASSGIAEGGWVEGELSAPADTERPPAPGTKIGASGEKAKCGASEGTCPAPRPGVAVDLVSGCGQGPPGVGPHMALIL